MCHYILYSTPGQQAIYIVLQQNKSVVDSISASDNTYEIGASFEGDGGLFNSATLIGSSPPFNEEFALQTFST